MPSEAQVVPGSDTPYVCSETFDGETVTTTDFVVDTPAGSATTVCESWL